MSSPKRCPSRSSLTPGTVSLRLNVDRVGVGVGVGVADGGGGGGGGAKGIPPLRSSVVCFRALFYVVNVVFFRLGLLRVVFQHIISSSSSSSFFFD